MFGSRPTCEYVGCSSTPSPPNPYATLPCVPGVVVQQHPPVNVSTALDTGIHDSNKAPRYPPPVQDFVWNGIVKSTTSRVECLPGAPLGVVQCAASITISGRITRFSFGIEVVKSPPGWSSSDVVAVVELDTTWEEVGADVAAIRPNEPMTSDNVFVRGVQVSTGVETNAVGRRGMICNRRFWRSHQEGWCRELEPPLQMVFWHQDVFDDAILVISTLRYCCITRYVMAICR